MQIKKKQHFAQQCSENRHFRIHSPSTQLSVTCSLPGRTVVRTPRCATRLL